MSDPVNHPPHYKSHPSGIECIQITEHMSFCLGNAIKYIWRADLKNDAIEDLKKARWYLDREIQKRQEAAMSDDQPILRHNGVGIADMYSPEEYERIMADDKSLKNLA